MSNQTLLASTEKFSCNKEISKSKQKSCCSKWHNVFLYLEYSPSLDRAYCFACSLFCDGPGSLCTETNRSSDGLNRWDKMKSKGKNKKGQLLKHFGSAAYELAAERLENFKRKDSHVDVAIISARKQLLAKEEKERLQDRKIFNVLLPCCRYFSRQGLAFRGTDDDVNGNFRQLVILLIRWTPFLKNWFASARSCPYHVTNLMAILRMSLLASQLVKLVKFLPIKYVQEVSMRSGRCNA